MSSMILSLTYFKILVAKKTKVATRESFDGNLDQILVSVVEGIDCEHISDCRWTCR